VPRITRVVRSRGPDISRRRESPRIRRRGPMSPFRLTLDKWSWAESTISPRPARVCPSARRRSRSVQGPADPARRDRTKRARAGANLLILRNPAQRGCERAFQAKIPGSSRRSREFAWIPHGKSLGAPPPRKLRTAALGRGRRPTLVHSTDDVESAGGSSQRFSTPGIAASPRLFSYPRIVGSPEADRMIETRWRLEWGRFEL